MHAKTHQAALDLSFGAAGRIPVLLAAVFLNSLAFLALQLGLTRLLSALLSHHYVFAVVALALLGLGLGGVLTHALHARRRVTLCGFSLLALYAAAGALSSAAALAGVLGLAQAPYFYSHALWYFAILFAPFLAGGLFFAEAYRQFPRLSGQVYGADLMGAAVGSLIAIALLNLWGGIGGSYVLTAMMAAAACLLAVPVRSRRGLVLGLSLAALLLTTALALLQIGGRLVSDIPRHINPDKEIYDAIHGPWRGEIMSTRWSAFGRTEMIRYRDNDAHRDIYIDGTAGTPMYRFSGDFANPGPAVEKLQAEFPGAFPFRFLSSEQRGRALIIGPGGGRDVLLAASAGFDQITAVEVNPDLLQLVREQRAFNGGLYTDFEHIRVVQAEGRHFIKRDRSRYDLIMLSLPVTNTSRSREGFALTESFLLTAEALGDYLEHLTPQGQLLVITHDELAVVRLLRLALDAMQARGVGAAQAMQHLYVVGSFPYPVVVIGQQPLEPRLAPQILRQIHQAGYSVNASYAPYIRQQGLMNPMLQALGLGALDLPAMEQVVAGYGHDISTVSDNRPFFYNMDPGLPAPLPSLLWTALAAAALVCGYPLLRGLPSGQGRRRLPAYVLLFAALGFGFMLIEISVVQRLTFFLGDPVLALAVLLFSLLVFMGLGSLASSRIPPPRLKAALSCSGFAVAAAALGYALVLPALLDWLLPLSLTSRVLCALLLLAPLAALLGLPFPLGLRLLAGAGNAQAIPWMWAINGVLAVLGAVAAVALAMWAGLNHVLLAAAFCYALLPLAMWIAPGVQVVEAGGTS